MVISRFGSWLDGLLLDFKLALRMLVRYPLLPNRRRGGDSGWYRSRHWRI